MYRATLLPLLALLAASVYGQTVSSSVVGTVLDPQNAAIPNAAVTLTDDQTGTARHAMTDSSGLFRFLEVTPGNYSVSVQMQGFKTFLANRVAVGAQETRDVGRLMLELGNSTEKISVIAEATPVQTSSSEKSQMVDGHQLNDITLKGRDLFGYYAPHPRRD